MTTEPKPLAKSLHTVTVLVRMAEELAACGALPPEVFTPAERVDSVLRCLGLADKPDPYGLREAALKQLED